MKMGIQMRIKLLLDAFTVFGFMSCRPHHYTSKIIIQITADLRFRDFRVVDGQMSSLFEEITTDVFGG